MISLENVEILTPFQKLPMNVVDLGKLIVAKGFDECVHHQPSGGINQIFRHNNQNFTAK